MSMDSYVVGIVPPDDTWMKMKAIYDICLKAKVTIPKEVVDFFGGDVPDRSGVIVEIPHTIFNEHGVGYDVKVEDIPKHVKIIRFYNSW